MHDGSPPRTTEPRTRLIHPPQTADKKPPPPAINLRLGQQHRLGLAHRIGNQLLPVKTLHRFPVEATSARSRARHPMTLEDPQIEQAPATAFIYPVIHPVAAHREKCTSAWEPPLVARSMLIGNEASGEDGRRFRRASRRAILGRASSSLHRPRKLPPTGGVRDCRSGFMLSQPRPIVVPRLRMVVFRAREVIHDARAPGRRGTVMEHCGSALGLVEVASGFSRVVGSRASDRRVTAGLLEYVEQRRLATGPRARPRRPGSPRIECRSCVSDVANEARTPGVSQTRATLVRGSQRCPKRISPLRVLTGAGPDSGAGV